MATHVPAGPGAGTGADGDGGALVELGPGRPGEGRLTSLISQLLLALGVFVLILMMLV